jgi:class 3 adenylate cyclase
MAGAAQANNDLIARIEVIWESALHDTDSAMAESTSLLDEARRRGEPRAEGLARRNRSYLFQFVPDLKASLEEGIEALRILQEAQDALGAATAAYHVATMYVEIGSPERGLEFGTSAQKLAAKAGEPRWQAWAFDALGGAAVGLGNYEQAAQYYDQALEIFESIEYTNGIVRVLGKIAELRTRQGRPESALACFERIMATEGLPAALLKIQRIAYADVLVNLDRLDEAEVQLEIVRDRTAESHEDLYTLKRLIIHGVLLQKRGLVAAAIARYEEAMKLAQRDHRKADELAITWKLCSAVRESGDFERAWQLAERYRELGQETAMDDRRERTRLIRIQFEVEQTLTEAEFNRQRKQELEALLLKILPGKIVEELRVSGQAAPVAHQEATILFADVVNFTPHSATLSPHQLVDTLHLMFTRFDAIMAAHGIEKLKTIGDAYMAVAGVPEARSSHAVDAAHAAHAMIQAAATLREELGTPNAWHIRVGLNSGPVVSGIVGTHKFAYDIWGSAVNLASRMEHLSLPDRITVSDRTAGLLRDHFSLESRGELDVKGVGPCSVYFLGERLS